MAMASPSSVRRAASLLLRHPPRSSRKQPDICNSRNRCIGSTRHLRGHSKAQPSYTTAFETNTELFSSRHIGPTQNDIPQMLKALSSPPSDLEDFIGQTLPKAIRSKEALKIDDNDQGWQESQVSRDLEKLAAANKQYKTY